MILRAEAGFAEPGLDGAAGDGEALLDAENPIGAHVADIGQRPLSVGNSLRAEEGAAIAAEAVDQGAGGERDLTGFALRSVSRRPAQPVGGEQGPEAHLRSGGGTGTLRGGGRCGRRIGAPGQQQENRKSGEMEKASPAHGYSLYSVLFSSLLSRCSIASDAA